MVGAGRYKSHVPALFVTVAPHRAVVLSAVIVVGLTAAVLPVSGHRLGPTVSFVPAMLAVVVCFDVMSMYLLVGEYRDGGDLRLLVMSSAYLWSLVTLSG